MYTNKVTNEQGRSMIEMLGVLAIVGVLSVAGIQGYSKAMGKYKANKVMDQVSTIAANTKTLFASVGSYAGLSSSAQAYKLKLFPEEMLKTCADASKATEDLTTTCVLNGLNGGTTVKTVSGGLSFDITMGGLTKEACVAVLTSDWGGASGFKGVSLGTKATTGTGTGTSTTVAPGTSGFALAKTCADAGNKVIWEFY